MNDPIRILIADDHPIVRGGLSGLLVARNGMTIVGEATNGAEVVALAMDLQPDVILLDLVMPNMNGVEAITLILQNNSDARILVLSSFGQDEIAGHAIRAGAIGFLHKDSQPEDLLQAIRSVHQGQLTIPLNLARTWHLIGSQIRATKSALTPREEQVLKAVSQGLSNRQIAEQLAVGTNTIRAHISSLLNKLDLSNRTELAIYALKHNSHGA